MKRGAVTKKTSRLINFWAPLSLFPVLDKAIKRTDSDYSKFIRTAIREKIERVEQDTK